MAVKLLHPAFVDQQELQQRFEIEAKAIAKLNHPNCITLYDFGFSQDLNAFYTVIEYIDGISLDKKLGQDVPLDEILNIIRAVTLALDHAHQKGILHRDLKPENIMVGHDGAIKVLDFGIARMMHGDSEDQRVTKAGEVFGTPAYMSPEQARSARELTPAADLYSVGVMFYELLEGKLPFSSNSAFDLLMMHVTQPVPPMTRTDIPADLQSIVMRLLDKTPENRFQTGKELVAALEQFLLPDFATSSQEFARSSRSAEIPRHQTPTHVTPPEPQSVHIPDTPPVVFLGRDSQTHATTDLDLLPASKKTGPILIAGVFLLLLLGGTGAFFFLTKDSPAQNQHTPEILTGKLPAQQPEQVEPETVQVEPEAVQVEPETAQVEPEAVQVEPEAVQVEPEAAQVEPEAAQVEPEAAQVEPEPVARKDQNKAKSTKPPKAKSPEVQVVPPAETTEQPKEPAITPIRLNRRFDSLSP